MNDKQDMDLESKVEDALISILTPHLDDGLTIAPWGEDIEEDPSVVVKATRGEAVSIESGGDMWSVGVVITLTHGKGSYSRYTLRCIENGLGFNYQLCDRLTEASDGAAKFYDIPEYGTSSKEISEGKIRREIVLYLRAAHLC